MDEFEEAEAKAAMSAHTDEPPKSGFVVSLTDPGRRRCFHHVGSCWRLPGVHYLRFIAYGSVLPEPSEVDARCHNCFPTDTLAPVIVADPEEVAEADEDDTSESDTDAAHLSLRSRSSSRPSGPSTAGS